MFFLGKPLPPPPPSRNLPGIFILFFGIFLVFETSSRAAPLNISGGPRFSYLTLERTGKLPSGKHLRGDSQEEGSLGLVLNINFGRWFFGSDLSSRSAHYESGTFEDPNRLLTGGVDFTEVNMGLGFLVFREFGPFLAFSRHKQTTSDSCPGCRDTFQFSGFGPGLSLSYPFSESRWGGYARGSYIRGYNWEAGFSYSGIRMPLLGVVGFRHRVINYSPGENPCGGGATGCYLTRDKIYGPVVSLFVVF